MSVRLDLTRDELGLLIDGVAHLVDPSHREAADLLRRLQEAYGQECGRFYAPPELADYLFCYEPKGHAGSCDFQPRRRENST